MGTYLLKDNCKLNLAQIARIPKFLFYTMMYPQLDGAVSGDGKDERHAWLAEIIFNCGLHLYILSVNLLAICSVHKHI